MMILKSRNFTFVSDVVKLIHLLFAPEPEEGEPRRLPPKWGDLNINLLLMWIQPQKLLEHEVRMTFGIEEVDPIQAHRDLVELQNQNNADDETDTAESSARRPLDFEE